MSADLLVAFFVFSGSLGLAAYGGLRDLASSSRLRERLEKLQQTDDYKERQLLAYRHWVTILTAWGVYSKEPPPRAAPSPPPSLLEDGP